MDEPKELNKAKSLLKKASEDLAAKNEEINKLHQDLAEKDKLISELSAKNGKISKEHETVSKELKDLKQEARDVELKKQIIAEEKMGILEMSKEDRLAELRKLDEAGGFELYQKQTQKMLELHNSIGDRKTLVNNSNQAEDAKQEIAQALGMKV